MATLDLICLLPPAEQDSIINGPALAPPDGVTPDYQNPPNMSIIAEVVTPILVTVVALLVLLRFCSKLVVQRSAHIEDVLCLLGFGTYIGYVWCVYRAIHVLGLYVHQWNVYVSNVLDMLHVFQYFVNFYAVTLLFMKAAILLEWMRIFAPPGSSRGIFYRACQVVFVITTLFYISIEVAGNLSCRPFESIWNKRICGTCFDRTKLDITTGALNVASHLAILILPQGIIWKLQLPLQKKIGIAVVFMFGILAVICACLRLAVTVQYSFAEDWTYAISPLALWCLAELTCVFIVFCIPGLPKAFRVFQTWSSNWSSQRASKKSSRGADSSKWPSADSKSLNPISSKYQPIHDSGSLPLQDMGSQGGSLAPAGPQDERAGGGGGILREREVSVTSETMDEERPSNAHQYQQGAWAGSDVQRAPDGGRSKPWEAYHMA